MSVYRRKFAYQGKTKASKRYTAEFQYRGRLYRRAGFFDRETAQHWIRQEQIRLSRNEIGMVKPSLAAATQSLIDDFAEYLGSLNSDEMYVYVTKQRLNRLVTECKWGTIGDISLETFTRWRTKAPKYRGVPLAAKTLNQFLDHAVQFCQWLVTPMGKLAVNPLAGATRATAAANAKYRRAGTLEEFEKLLATCPPDRRRQYLFRLCCPIRRKSIRALTWSHLHLDAKPPFGELDVFENKGRRRVKFAIRQDLAADLLSVKGDPDERVFDKVLEAEHLREDLEAAGVKFADEKGNRRLDFHAFRRSFVALAKSRGAKVEDLHLAMHHRDRSTTEKYYSEDAVDPRMSDLANRLPSLVPTRKGDETTSGL